MKLFDLWDFWWGGGGGGREGGGFNCDIDCFVNEYSTQLEIDLVSATYLHQF